MQFTISQKRIYQNQLFPVFPCKPEIAGLFTVIHSLRSKLNYFVKRIAELNVNQMSNL